MNTAGIVYVGCSRVRTLNNLHFIRFAPEATFTSPLAMEEYKRLRANSLNDEQLPQYDLINVVNKLPEEYERKRIERKKRGSISSRWTKELFADETVFEGKGAVCQ